MVQATALPRNEDGIAAAVGVLKQQFGDRLQTGQAIREQHGHTTTWIDTHAESGAQITGFEVPCFRAALELAVKAHAVFPINGFLGWDVAIGPDGPVLIECNENSGHMLYQLASGRGVLNDDFKPVFERVIARNDRLRATARQEQKALEARRALASAA